jgi:Uma2 family endonuclease
MVVSMNAPTIIANQKPKISVADLFHLIESGVMDPDAKFELVEGQIVPMSPQGPLHQDIQNWLGLRLTLALSDRFWVAQGSTLILPENTALDPDICVYPLSLKAADLAGDKVVLVVEIAVSSKRYDLGVKAELYTRMGVKELWVVDVNARTTHVHRDPDAGGWGRIQRVPFEEPLSPVAAADVVVRISDAG